MLAMFTYLINFLVCNQSSVTSISCHHHPTPPYPVSISTPCWDIPSQMDVLLALLSLWYHALGNCLTWVTIKIAEVLTPFNRLLPVPPSYDLGSLWQTSHVNLPPPTSKILLYFILISLKMHYKLKLLSINSKYLFSVLHTFFFFSQVVCFLWANSMFP